MFEYVFNPMTFEAALESIRGDNGQSESLGDDEAILTAAACIYRVFHDGPMLPGFERMTPVNREDAEATRLEAIMTAVIHAMKLYGVRRAVGEHAYDVGTRVRISPNGIGGWDIREDV